MLVHSDMNKKTELVWNIAPLHHKKKHHIRELTELETMYQNIKYARNEGA